MTSFMTAKRKFKFQVDFLLADLSDLPLVNASLFAKIRLLNGGSFQETTEASRVANHHVCWDKTVRFGCRISCDPTTGILEPCLCRVSIRKETRGGKSFDKLGYIDVNLSEFGGSGVDGCQRTYLLEGYNSQQRQDNSRLRICVCMTLQSADPYFKVPRFDPSRSSGVSLRRHRQTLSGNISMAINPAERRAEDGGETADSLDVTPKVDDKDLRGTSGISFDSSDEHLDHLAVEPPTIHSRSNSDKNGTANEAQMMNNQRVIDSVLNSTPPEHPSTSTIPPPVVHHPALVSPTPIGENNHNPSRCEFFSNFLKIFSKTAETRVDAMALIDDLLEEELHDELVQQKNVNDEQGLSLFVSTDGSATVTGSSSVPSKHSVRVVVDGKQSSPNP